MTGGRLRLGPVILCASAAVYRAVWLSVELSGFDLFELGYLLLADAPVLGLLALLALAEGTAPRRWKVLPLLLTGVLLAFYLADIVAVLVLNARLQLADLRQFVGEWWVIRSFVSAASIAVLVTTAASFFIHLNVPPRPAGLLRASALVLLLVPLAVRDSAVPSHVRKYTGSVLLLAKELWGSRSQPVTRYGPGDFSAYRREYEAIFEAPFASTRRNIILVIVESLSAADSHRTSGIRNALPRLDALSEKGVLFRNFLANFEASEGGIVALTSGVPPLHFPTASTNTFGEYALQRSIVETYKRNGYHTEFLTNVPLQFISMDHYARSPIVGFSVAAGQREIFRYKDAPRFAFESPADRVLYEELLARLDAKRREGDQPVLMAAITASSHAPYVDPLGRGNTAAHAWSYVQEELWWLHDQLSMRQFFDNGLLIITGDHRRMTPIQEAERERYGDSAKARIPLLIIGTDVARGRIDDRLFQQSDLLRMLDRVTQPQAELSPFALWVERYVFVYGVASNASNLEVFDAGNAAREGFRLKLHGSDIEWLTRPPAAFAVERAVHRQRAMQQAVRAARLTHSPLKFGRALKPADGAPGVLVGLSTDVDLGRDPDDPAGSLQTFTADSLELDKLISRRPDPPAAFTMTARAFFSVPQDGEYWFSLFADDEGCLAIDHEIVLGCHRGLNEGLALLTAGIHRLDLRYADRGGNRSLRLKWLPPGSTEFVPLSQELFLLPQGND